MSEQQTALVSGGGGFIGLQLVEALTERGDHVRTFGRRPRPEELPDEVDYRRFDLGGTDLVDPLVGDVDVLYHVAGASSTTSTPEEMEEVNVGGTTQLLQAAYEAGVRRVVHVSTSSVYGNQVPLPQPVSEDAECHPGAGYAESKWRAEQVAWEYAAKGLEVAVLRPVTVFGPGAVKLVASVVLDAAIERFAGLDAFAVPREPVEMRLVHVDDVIDACLHLAASDSAPGRAFNLASGVYPSSHEIAEPIAEELGLRLELSDDSDPGLPTERRREIHEQMLAAGMRDRLVLSSQRIRYLRKANANNRLSMEALAGTGFQPRHTDIPAELRESVRWYEAQGWIV